MCVPKSNATRSFGQDHRIPCQKRSASPPAHSASHGGHTGPVTLILLRTRDGAAEGPRAFSSGGSEHPLADTMDSRQIESERPLVDAMDSRQIESDLGVGALFPGATEGHADDHILLVLAWDDAPVDGSGVFGVGSAARHVGEARRSPEGSLGVE